MRSVALTAFALVLLATTMASARLLPPKADKLTAAYTYDMYLSDHNKKPAKCPVEFKKRKAIFEKNLADILRHNANPKKSFSKGVNRFSDWTETEYKGVLGARHEPSFQSRRPERVTAFRAGANLGATLASELDYRRANPAVLTAVKDQGMCGDCWAHAVTEAIESAYARATGQLLVLSQQQITSCTPAEGSCYSCNGMYPRYAYEYAADTPTLMEEWVYPFTSYLGSNPACNNMTNPAYPLNNFVTMYGYTQLAPNNQLDILNALNMLGPLSVLVNAEPWMHYESGVFDGCLYNKNFSLDHAVQLVGYGYDQILDMDYWIVRNSWSAGWGEHGYIRVKKEANVQCGVNAGGMSCFAGNNNTQGTPACGMCGILSDAQFPNVNAVAPPQPQN